MPRITAAVGAIALFAALAAACGGGSDEESSKQLTLGALTVSDHGTKDITKSSTFDVEADDFYFSPTFLKGNAGEKVTLTFENDSNSLHNVSIAALGIDKDIPAKGKVDVNVTFPNSGAVLFVCKYHTGQGMNGELLVGDATPQALAPVSATVKIANSGTLGPLLTDGAGLSLYTYKNDVPNSGKSAVNGNLATAWPPLVLAGGSPVPASGLTGELTLITRDDGTKQVAYKGMPLYRYARDTSAGDTNGQNVGGVWFVVAP